MKLANIFQDGMILQRDTPLKIWGTAAPQTEVSVNGKTTISREMGEWEITLDPLPAGGPYEISVASLGEEIILKDVLAGDVWLCSGQSNMELPMSRVKRAFPGEVENTVNPQIRQFHVPVTYDFEGPQSEIPGQGWISVSPEQSDAFSATGYFFAKKIQQEVGVPIGIILSAAGGTPIETWLSEKSLQKFPQHLLELEQLREAGYVQTVQDQDNARNSEWYRKLDAYDLGLYEKWQAPEMDDSSWRSMDLMQSWATDSQLQQPGAIWLRKEVDLPAGSGKIDLGTLSDADFVYINGELVGSTGYQYPPRIYPVAAFKDGKNVIAVRVIVNAGIGGFTFGKDRHLVVNDKKIPLDGTWKFRRGVTMPALGSTTFFQNKPTGCYNAMIAPLHRFAIKGALWYQGESNAGHPEGYGERLQTLVEDWRQCWELGNFPFIGVQLANWVHTGLNWSLLRQEQSRLLDVPKTGLAVAIDAGEANDLHPLDKKTVGQRLALQALKGVYGKNTIADGPQLIAVSKEEESIALTFDSVVKGEGEFEIEIGETVVPVNAKNIGEKVILSGVGLREATFVRYAWTNNPIGILYNEVGLPAAPFRRGVE